MVGVCCDDNTEDSVVGDVDSSDEGCDEEKLLGRYGWNPAVGVGEGVVVGVVWADSEL